MANIVHRIGIHAPASKVFQALATVEGLSSWWTEEVSGKSEVGERLEFLFKSKTGELKGKMVMKVQKLNPGRQVLWTCEVGPEEWIGTDIVFDLAEEGDQTILRFGHRDWKEEVEMTYHCSMKWAIFLLSLREYIENGKGKPSPNDIKIDNWN